MLNYIRHMVVALAVAIAPGAALAGHGEYNGDNPGENLTHESFVVCQSATLFGNYRDGKHVDPIMSMPYGTRVGWRYTTTDGRSAMVLHYQSNTWGYVLTSCLSFYGPPGTRA